MTIHICDDCKLIYEGLNVLLKSEGIKVTGYSKNGKEIIKWLEKNSVDILIMDYKMPELDGGEVLEYFKANNIKQKTLIISEFDDFYFINHCIKNDADGYMLKSECFAEILRALKHISSGLPFFSKSVKDTIIRHNQGNNKKELYNELSEKQKEVLSLIQKGYGNDEICLRLSIKKSTFRTHKLRIKEKLNINSDIGLMRIKPSN